MRVCQRGWEYAQIFGEEGAVEICSWASMNYHPIGKLTEQSMYDIWHGEAAKKFRQSLIDGSYCYCEKEKCPWMANGTLEEHMKEYDGELEYPKDVSLSFQRTCNYTCVCCADNENINPRQCNADENLEIIQRETEKFLNDVTTISANGRGELFASKHIMNMLHNWKPTSPAEDIQVILETNGSLFDEKHWKIIENLGKYNLKVSITVMGFDEKTYQFLSGTKLPVQRIVDNLHFVKGLREKGIVNFFEIGTVIQERNFREMPEFSRRCVEEFHADCVRLRPYFPWGNTEPIFKWFYDIRNPYHPYYSEYEQMWQDPIFDHPNVMMWSGEELSDAGKNPFQRDFENYDELIRLCTDRHIKEKLESYFSDHQMGRIMIHGFGVVGQAVVNLLLDTSITIDAVIDKNRAGQCYEGIRIHTVEEMAAKADVPLIITAPFYFDEIGKELKDAGVEQPIYNIKNILDEINR